MATIREIMRWVGTELVYKDQLLSSVQTIIPQLKK